MTRPCQPWVPAQAGQLGHDGLRGSCSLPQETSPPCWGVSLAVFLLPLLPAQGSGQVLFQAPAVYPGPRGTAAGARIRARHYRSYPNTCVSNRVVGNLPLIAQVVCFLWLPAVPSDRPGRGGISTGDVQTWSQVPGRPRDSLKLHNPGVGAKAPGPGFQPHGLGAGPVRGEAPFSWSQMPLLLPGSHGP